MKDRKIFLKGKVYTCQNTIVMCTETTCSYSSDIFKGIMLKETKDYPAGRTAQWLCESFQELTDNIIL